MPRSAEKSKKIFLLLGDAALIILSTQVSVLLRFAESRNVLTYYTGATVFILSAYVLSFYIFDLYNVRTNFKGTYFLARFVAAVGSASLVIITIFYFLPHWKLGRGLSVLNLVFIAVSAYFWRILFQRTFSGTWKPRRVAILGAGRAGEMIMEIIRTHKGVDVRGLLDDDAAKTGMTVGGRTVLGTSSMLCEMTDREEIDSVVVAITNEKRPELLKALLYAKLRGVDIYDLPLFLEETTGTLPVEHIRDGWMAYAPFQGMRKSLYAVKVKRVLDILLSFTCLVITAPVTFVTAVIVKIETRGPAFFLQERVGLNGKTFKIVKLRSMRVDAEQEGEAVWASENDSRVTRAGKFIRKARIDELPQLWNVLRGEMSFIGPRPERPEFVKELEKEIPYYRIRCAVKPGITGWAQVNYKYGASQEDAVRKLEYDLYYIKNLSFFLDLQIVLKTIRVVFFGEGSR